MMQRAGLALCWLAVGLGLVAFGVEELQYVDRAAWVAPVVEVPLAIRHDAMGSGEFGAARRQRMHQGLDFTAPLGSSVYAVRSGWVIAAKENAGYGQYVELLHRGGWRSRYAHLSGIEVLPGQRVRQGELIGWVGKTGNARHHLIQPHLHFELRQGQTVVDPAEVFRPWFATEPSPDEAAAHASHS